MTKEEIEQKAVETGKKPGEVLKEEAPQAAEAKPKIPRMQYVIVVMADGRRGVFAGPELVTKAEMTLNCVPRLVSVDFTPPRDVEEPKPLAEVIQEASDAKQAPDSPGEPAPEAGLV